MAGFADIVRMGVALADSLTITLQAKVKHEAWIGTDGFSGDIFADPVFRDAIIENKQRLVRGLDGEEVVSTHTISILRPIDPRDIEGRQEPIDARDRFTLPDGSTGKVLNVGGLIDPDIGASYFHQVWLG